MAQSVVPNFTIIIVFMIGTDYHQEWENGSCLPTLDTSQNERISEEEQHGQT